MDLQFRDIKLERKEYETHELSEGMVVYADVGTYITNLRPATITNIGDDTIELSLGGMRMDGPYYVPVSNIYGIISHGS